MKQDGIGKKRNLTVSYSLVLGTYWTNYAGLLGFSSVYLLSRGLTTTVIGIVVALSGLLTALLQPVVAQYADRENSPSLKRIVLVFCALAFFTSALLPLAWNSAVLSGMTYCLSLMFLQFLQPFMVSLGTEWIRRGEKLNWGVSRGMGSLFYAAASYLVGATVARFGEMSIPFSAICSYGQVFLCVLLYPFEKRPAEEKSRQEKEKTSTPLDFIRKYPRFFLVLCGSVCLFISHYYLNIYVYQIIEAKGGGSRDVGIVLAICALLELPALFLWNTMTKKVKCQTWMKLCCTAVTLKAVGSLLAVSMSMFYLVQLCQFLGFALLAVTPVYYTLMIVKREDAIQGQAYTAMTGTLGNIFASLTGGRLIDAAGINVMLTAACIAGAAGMLLYFLFIDPRAEMTANET